MSVLTPSAEMMQAVVDLAAADPATLAPAALANHVHLIKTDVNPDTYHYSAGDEASFTGAGAKSAGVGAQTVYTDSVTQDRVILIKDPAGGWVWVCTVAPLPDPETIFAVVLTDNADAVTLGVYQLLPPIVITNIGDAVVVGSLEFRFPPAFMEPESSP